MKQQNTVKFFYLRDAKEPQRVLTVARSLKKGKKSTKVLVGWAVTRPTQKNEWNEVVVDGDQFRKDRGRLIATGRMLKSPIKAKLGEEETPNWVAMKALSKFTKTRTNEYGEEVDIVPRHVRRMAKEYVENLSDSPDEETTMAIPGTDRNFRNFLKRERQLKNEYPAEMVYGEKLPTAKEVVDHILSQPDITTIAQPLENEVPEDYTSESE